MSDVVCLSREDHDAIHSWWSEYTHVDTSMIGYEAMVVSAVEDVTSFKEDTGISVEKWGKIVKSAACKIKQAGVQPTDILPVSDILNYLNQAIADMG